MTPEELAKRIHYSNCYLWNWTHDGSGPRPGCICYRIEAAVEQEREACAKIAEMRKCWPGTNALDEQTKADRCDEIAAAIRARKEKS